MFDGKTLAVCILAQKRQETGAGEIYIARQLGPDPPIYIDCKAVGLAPTALQYKYGKGTSTAEVQYCKSMGMVGIWARVGHRDSVAGVYVCQDNGYKGMAGQRPGRGMAWQRVCHLAV